MDDNTITADVADVTSALSVNPIISIHQNIVQLTKTLNSWSSRMIVLHGDQYVDIFSAAQGPLSIPPVGIIPPQEIKDSKDDIILPCFFP
jgi:hypothetical protein